MEIAKWNETSIEIKPNGNTDVYSKNFFSAKDVKGEEVKKYKIAIKGEFVEIDFGVKIKSVKINGISINRVENTNVRVVEEKNNMEFEIDNIINKYEIPTVRTYETIINDGNLYLINSTAEDVELDIIIKTYFKETYPDFSQKKVKTTLICGANSETIIAKSEVGKIIEVEIPIVSKTEILEYVPVYYFTTVTNLKTYLKDTGYLLPTKTDEEHKSKISEKSTYLKRRFGLLPLQLEDFEYYPAYAKLVHLYCLYDYCVYNFISGDNAGVGEGTGGITGGSVTLGKFSTKESGTTGTSSGSSSSASGYIPSMVKEKIKEAEADLEKSIFIKSVSFKTGGVTYADRSNISRCFSNR